MLLHPDLMLTLANERHRELVADPETDRTSPFASDRSVDRRASLSRR